MNRFLIAATLLALCATPAFAADDPMAGFYGNTVVSTGGSATIRTHYRADHTFDFTGSMLFMSKTFRGTWALDGKGGLCRTYIGDPPPDTPNPVRNSDSAYPVADRCRSSDNARTRNSKANTL